MHKVDPVYLEHQLKRWMRPDAHRFVRPDWRRFVRAEFQHDHPFALYEQKYSPDQPRVPAGSREGGRWTTEEGKPGETQVGGSGTNTNHQSTMTPVSADSNPSSESPIAVQFTADDRSPASDRLLAAGGEVVGTFGDRVSIVKDPSISHQESFDQESGLTILSFTGVGSVVVDEKLAIGTMGLAYRVGMPSRPDQGLSIVIDRNNRVRAYSTSGS